MTERLDLEEIERLLATMSPQELERLTRVAEILDATKTSAARVPLVTAAVKDGSVTKDQGMELLSITVICKCEQA